MAIPSTKTLGSKFREMAKHGAVYGGGTAIQHVVSFGLLLVFTHFLSTEHYGILSILSILTDVLFFVFSVGVFQALLRFYFDHSEPGRRSAVVKAAVCIVCVSVTLLLVLAAAGSGPLSNVIFGTASRQWLIRLAAAVAAFRILHQIPMAVLRLEKRSVFFMGSRIALTGAILLFSLVFVVMLKQDVAGVLKSRLLSFFILFLILGFSIRAHLRARVIPDDVKDMLLFGLPVIVSNIGVYFFTYADVFMLKYLSNLEQVGLYSLGYQFGMLTRFMIDTPVKMVWGPTFMSYKDEADFPVFCSKTLTYLVMVSGGFFLGVSLLSKEVLDYCVAPEYRAAYAVIPIVTFSYLLWSARYILRTGLFIERRMPVDAANMLLGGVLNIILNIFWIPRYGMTGAAWATLTSFCVMLAVLIGMNQRTLKIPYEWGRIVKILLITLGLFVIGYNVYLPPVFLLAVKTGLIVLYVACLRIWRIISDKDVFELKQIIKQGMAAMKKTVPGVGGSGG